MAHMSQQSSSTMTIPEWTIADRLRKARECTGLSQNEFADETGISRNTVSNYENGNTRPGRVYLAAWAMRCGVPPEWLATGFEPQDLPPDHGNAASTWTPSTSSVVPISANSERRRSTRPARTAVAA